MIYTPDLRARLLIRMVIEHACLLIQHDQLLLDNADLLARLDDLDDRFFHLLSDTQQRAAEGALLTQEV